MFFETFDTEITPVFASVVLGVLMGLAFGVAAQMSRFCLRRGLVTGEDRRPALGVWITALLVAILGTQFAVAGGYLDFSGHRLQVPALPVLAVLVGGALFGAREPETSDSTDDDYDKARVQNSFFRGNAARVAGGAAFVVGALWLADGP